MKQTSKANENLSQCSKTGLYLTLNAPIATKVVCFFCLLKCLRRLWQTVWSQIRLLLAVCSGSTLFASILNLSVMLGNFLQQTTSADDFFRCIFFLGALRVNSFHASDNFCCLPITYKKQFGQNVGPDPNPNHSTLIVFLKEF